MEKMAMTAEMELSTENVDRMQVTQKPEETVV